MDNGFPTTPEYETALAWVLITDPDTIQHMLVSCRKFCDSIPAFIWYLDTYIECQEMIMPFTDVVSLKQEISRRCLHPTLESRRQAYINFLKGDGVEQLRMFMDLIFYIVKVKFSTEPFKSKEPLKSIKRARNFFYNGVLKRLRGDRVDVQSSVLRPFYGITNRNILPYVSKYPFRKWGQDVCRVVPGRSEFSNEAHKVAPVKCGLSGSSGMVWWQLVHCTDLELNMIETKYFILMVWCCLCLDGGHSLHEILGSFDLVCTWMMLNEYPLHSNIHAVWKHITAFDLGKGVRDNIPPVSELMKVIKHGTSPFSDTHFIETYFKTFKIHSCAVSNTKPIRNYSYILKPVNELLISMRVIMILLS